METLGDRAERALRVVREAKEIAYDTETSGLDWKVNHPVGYVITTDDFNVYVPVRHGGGGNLLDPNTSPLDSPTAATRTHSFEVELGKAFEERRQRGFLTIGHHTKFDMHFSANAGIILGRNCACTQNTAAMLDEYARSYSLDSCAGRFGVTAKKGQELYDRIAALFGGEAKRDIMSEYWRLPGDDPVAVEYAMGDGTSTLELYRKQREAITAEDMDMIWQVESDLIYTFFRMERRGIKCDEAYIADLGDRVDKELDAALRKLPANFNVRSGPQVHKLFEESGVTDWPMTPGGSPSFTEKFLKRSELGRSIIAVRQLRNLMASFVVPLKERHIVKGRVHTNIHQLKADEFGTVGGRISTSDPNLLAVPKRNKEIGPRFRKIFVADDGMEFWDGDYTQAEPVLFAHYSKDPTLVAGYNATPIVDVHTLLAERINVERDPTAKRMNMGIFTGMQPKTFAEHMGWGLEEATNRWNEWFDTFPGVRDFQNKAKQVFGSTGYIKTLLGRRCRLEHPRFAYRGTSRVIQGGNADIMKYKLLEADRFLESENDAAHLLLSIYDSAEWQSPMGALGERLSAELVRIFTDLQGPPFNLRVPLGMEVDHGPSWAEATYGMGWNSGKS